jgi:hypothetical protein
VPLSKTFASYLGMKFKLHCLGVISFTYFFVELGLKFRAYTLSHSTSPFFVIFFLRQGLASYLLGWL